MTVTGKGLTKHWATAAAATLPPGRPLGADGLTARQRADKAICTYLHDAKCSDPACEEPATTALTPPGMPTFAQLRKGEHPRQLTAALASAVPFCHRHRKTRTAGGPLVITALDPAVAAAGGPRKLVLTLLGARTRVDVAAALDIPVAAAADLYQVIGVDLGTVLSYRRGERRAEPLGWPRPGGAAKGDAERVADLGGPDVMLRHLANAASERELTMLLGRRDGAMVRRNYAAFGVNLTRYLQQRVLIRASVRT